MVSATILEEHRTALTGHCYRMLGSLTEAEDAVQDTMLRAWRNRERFEGRSSLRTWLLRIATNVCLDALARSRKRVRPADLGQAGTVDGALTELPGEDWLEPVPDALALPADADPAERAMLRESIRLAFVSALQALPPRQRAVLLLTQVLGWSAAEAAATLHTSVPAVNSALQRARATLATWDAPPTPSKLSAEQTRLLEDYVAAFERYDVDALATLLHDDVAFSMPPYSLWLRGPEAVRAWLLGRGCGCRGSRLVPVDASGSPAFAQYREGGRQPWALVVLELEDDHIVGWTSFLDTATLFPRFGLPPTLPLERSA